jgi:hypothetical protein
VPTDLDGHKSKPTCTHRDLQPIGFDHAKKK